MVAVVRRPSVVRLPRNAQKANNTNKVYQGVRMQKRRYENYVRNCRLRGEKYTLQYQHFENYGRQHIGKLYLQGF